MVIGNLLLLLMRVAVETREATIVRVCPQRGLLGQMQFVLDRSDQFFPFQDASVGKKSEPLGFRIAHHPAATVLFILRLSGSFAELLPVFPHVIVPSGISQVIAVFLALA
jgi:hypothetical protein